MYLSEWTKFSSSKIKKIKRWLYNINYKLTLRFRHVFILNTNIIPVTEKRRVRAIQYRGGRGMFSLSIPLISTQFHFKNLSLIKEGKLSIFSLTFAIVYFSCCRFCVVVCKIREEKFRNTEYDIILYFQMFQTINEQ